jgi:hypothetical protein
MRRMTIGPAAMTTTTVRVRVFDWRMSAMGHQRRFDVGGMSAIAPIATKMLDRDERRKGPGTELEVSFDYRT